MKSPETAVNTSSVAIYSPCEEKCAECLSIRRISLCSKQNRTEVCRTGIHSYLTTQFKLNKANLTSAQLTIHFKNPRISEYGPLIQFFNVEIVADSNMIRRCNIDIEKFLSRDPKSIKQNRCHTYLLSILFEEMDNLLSTFGYTKISSSKVTATDYDFIYLRK